MIKILHSADWHLDSPIQGRTPEQTALLKDALLQIPHKVAAAAKAEDCQIMLLSGDLFDGAYTPESLNALRAALEEVQIPVFIAPGNHDFVSPQSPWLREVWPENVHIFTKPVMESVPLPELNCRVYGAAFTGAEAPSMLAGFRAQCDEIAIGVLHGDPTQASSPYCPISSEQVRQSGLAYLALGHIHKGGDFLAGNTLCAWSGCPMGRGFDELDAKGVLIVTVDDTCRTRFLPLDVPRFYELECEVTDSPAAALARVLPAVGSQDFFRISLTGECDAVDADALIKEFSQFPNLLLRDRTLPPIDLWASAGEDTLEGIYFRLLQQSMEGQEEAVCQQIRLAAKISRQLLEGREVKLP